MKKIYTAVFALLLGASAFAQPNQNFVVTSYRGAFDAAPTPMWTDNWTEWDPQNKAYPSANVTVNTNITSNTTWTSGNVYLISGLVYVKNNATLTIQPGTIIQGDKSTPNSSLVICQGAKINAAGTADRKSVV